MYHDFDNSVCTCLAKSNMDILFLLQDCSIPVRASSDLLVFSHSVFFLFMFVYVLIKKYFCNSVSCVLTFPNSDWLLLFPVNKIKLHRFMSQPPCTVNRWTGHPDCNIILMCNLIISEIFGKFNTTMAKEWSHAVPLPCCDPCQSSPPAHYRDRLYRKTAHWCSSAVNSQQTFWTTAHSDLQNKQETDCMGWE